MMRYPWRLISLGLMLTSAGCLPIRHTRGMSPDLSGRYSRSDGTSPGGVRLAIASDPADSLCLGVAAETQTDADGGFRLPRTSRSYRWLPLIGDWWPTFRLCSGPPADGFRASYFGTGVFRRDGAPQRLACVEWTWRNAPRLDCTSEPFPTFIEGGSWPDTAGSGFYRLLLVSDTVTLRGYERPILENRLVLHWVGRTAGGSEVIHEAVQLDTDPDFELSKPSLVPQNDSSWCGNVSGYNNRAWFKERRSFSFRLRGPGDVQADTTCAADLKSSQDVSGVVVRGNFSALRLGQGQEVGWRESLGGTVGLTWNANLRFETAFAYPVRTREATLCPPQPTSCVSDRGEPAFSFVTVVAGLYKDLGIFTPFVGVGAGRLQTGDQSTVAWLLQSSVEVALSEHFGVVATHRAVRMSVPLEGLGLNQELGIGLSMDLGPWRR